MKEARLQAGLESFASRRERDRPHAAVEELEAQMIFEPANLVAERSGRDVELQGRPGQAEMSGGGLEGAKRIQRRRRVMHEIFSSVGRDNILCHAGIFLPTSSGLDLGG